MPTVDLDALFLQLQTRADALVETGEFIPVAQKAEDALGDVTVARA